MKKIFNVTGACNPREHYMVDISERLKEIKEMVDAGQYFTINRARQYGKTTTLQALRNYLKDDYIVIFLDFQKLGNASFRDENTFSRAFADFFVKTVNNKRNPIFGVDESSIKVLENRVAEDRLYSLSELFTQLTHVCETARKPVVLLIDEVDSATNNQVFLDFLAQLRGYFLSREETPIFQSVILAGVHDIKNIKLKMREETESKINSPWNIATDFEIVMSFSRQDIMGLLSEYEKDNRTGMDISFIAGLLYDYTSGYPFLVSRICKIMDERLIKNTDLFEDLPSVWSAQGVVEAVKILETEKNALFESMVHKLQEYPELREMIYVLLFQGKEISFSALNTVVDIAIMFGFVKVENNRVVIANRIFETVLCSMFLSEEQVKSQMYDAALVEKNQFVKSGILDMKLILKKFVEHFADIYGDSDTAFIEDNGRRFFLLYLKPIINGTGNYYIEAQTRDRKRTDVIVDYLGKQYIIEMKIWHGQEYNKRGEGQLLEYLDYYHLDCGYMLSFNFNKAKETGVKEIELQGKLLVEAVV